MNSVEAFEHHVIAANYFIILIIFTLVQKSVDWNQIATHFQFDFNGLVYGELIITILADWVYQIRPDFFL